MPKKEKVLSIPKPKDSVEEIKTELSPNLSENENIRISSLSLRSAKSKEEEIQINEITHNADLPKELFSQADLFVYWKKYIDIITRQGEKILAATLGSTEPILNEFTIILTYPNAMMMEEVKKNQSKILNYLREKLQNYEISFELNYNETDEKNYIYTPQEKFEKLLEINPLLGEFRKTLHLDI